MNSLALWNRYKQYLCRIDNLGLEIDISRMMFGESFLQDMTEPISRALVAMDEVERGSIANLDENRMVGHYWLRAPELAPDPAIRTDIENTIKQVKRFADDVHDGVIKPEKGDGFYVILHIGIGGSALGPQFVADALGGADDPMIIRFIDNTDPDGIDRVLAELDEALPQTLTVVVSKSGATIETRNGMLEVAAAYGRAGLNFAKHAVAITGEGSQLHRKAVEEHWLRAFPMWDWVGGRTSVTSAVGLLPAALQGFDIDAFLAGARECDVATRNHDWRKNPAALLALMWYYAGEGHGTRDMVILPYRDRLALFGRYLQQLVMESLGKERDRDGKLVHQGLTVYGNKGCTDQHAYLQQLQDGINDFFVTFVRAIRDREGDSIWVEDHVTSGEYLRSFWQGTRRALEQNGRESVTITLDDVTAREVGILIALFERAVGLYAELVNVNAYHQPGVEAGKKAAGAIIKLQRAILAQLRGDPGSARTTAEIAEAVGAADSIEAVFHVLEHIAANDGHGIDRRPANGPFGAQYRAS